MPSDPISTMGKQAAATIEPPMSVSRPANAAMQRQNLPPSENVAAAQEQAPNIGDVHRAVEHLNLRAQHLKRDLQFSVDEASGQTVIRVFNTETKELVRQIPPKEILALAESLGKTDELTLFSSKV